MSDPGDSTVDVVRKATRELARKFDYGYWRAKTDWASTRGNSSSRSPTAGGWEHSFPRSTAAWGSVSRSPA